MNQCDALMRRLNVLTISSVFCGLLVRLVIVCSIQLGQTLGYLGILLWLGLDEYPYIISKKSNFCSIVLFGTILMSISLCIKLHCGFVG